MKKDYCEFRVGDRVKFINVKRNERQIGNFGKGPFIIIDINKDNGDWFLDLKNEKGGYAYGLFSNRFEKVNSVKRNK